MKKIAFLFLVYDDVKYPNVWERYWKGYEHSFIIRCHAANRKLTKTPFLSSNQIKTFVSTKWGDIGLIIAQIELMREALHDKNVERLVLCSDTCVPIKTYLRTYNLLFEKDMSWCAFNNTYLSRMAKVYAIPKECRRGNSQWVALTREHSEMLVHNNFTADFARCIIPDEHYVGSLLTYFGQEKRLLQKTQTDVQWKQISPVQYSPIEYKILKKNDIIKLKNSPSLFARKFVEGSDIYERWFDIASGD